MLAFSLEALSGMDAWRKQAASGTHLQGFLRLLGFILLPI